MAAKPLGRIRDNPKSRKVLPPPAEAPPIEEIAQKARYAGSTHHRTMPDKHGRSPTNKRGRTKCPKDLQQNPDLVQEWLKQGILLRQFGKFAKGDKFPRVVWYKDGETIFEARLTNRASGEYHGFALRSGQTVTGLN